MTFLLCIPLALASASHEANCIINGINAFTMGMICNMSFWSCDTINTDNLHNVMPVAS